MMINKAQMLKGLLDGCVLEIISRQETYGYKITEDLNEYGFKELNEGSVYPVLIRLEKKGFIKSESKVSPLGPKRKYFTISTDGNDYLLSFKGLWRDISSTVNKIIKGGVTNEI
jgi:PadR family transcriptional regulator PadR